MRDSYEEPVGQETKGVKLPVQVIVGAAGVMGVLANRLLWEATGPGLNMFLLFGTLALSVVVVAHAADNPLSTESATWLAVGVVCAGFLMWRGSEFLRVMTILAAFSAFAVPAFRAGASWLRDAGVLDVAESVVVGGLHAAFGSILALDPQQWPKAGGGEGMPKWARVGRMVAVGVALAAVPALVFGSILSSADPVFAALIGDLVSFNIEEIISHLAFTGVMAWLACGYLVGTVRGTRLGGAEQARRLRPTFGVPEVAVALGIVNLLFAGFVTVQFRYLFGGASIIGLVPDLTYASYAREGFFQLVAAVGLAIPWLLFTHAVIGERSYRSRWVFGGSAGVTLVLLFAVVGSAMQRLALYTEAYGLTEDRIVAAAILVGFGLILVWFGSTVLSGYGKRFAIGAAVTAYGVLLSLHLINPSDLVVRHNLERDAGAEIDYAHLAFTGADGVPELVERLERFPVEDRCDVADRLLSRWGEETESDWRSFNAGEVQARRIVRAASRSLAAFEQQCGERADAVRDPS